MKKYLLFVVLFLSCLSIQAQDENEALVSIAKMNWVGVSELPSWCYLSGDNDTSLEFVDDGIAINNPQKYDAIYTPQIIVIEGFTLEKGHNYIVRLIVRVPSDGTYHVNMGDWETNYSLQLPVRKSDDFQVIDVEYPEYGDNIIGNGHVLIGCGWVVGTTIIKEVEIREKTNATGIQSIKADRHNVIYNLNGQRVSPSYRGIAIQNGRKVVK